jgi:hypothetical protein
VFEESPYFEDAKYVTIRNCKKVIIESADIISSELEQLWLHHIHTIVFNVFLPSSLSSLEIEDVGNLTGLSDHVFLHVQYLHNLVIKNTNVQLIESHTFSDIFVKNIQFINTTFKYLKSSSLNFTGMEDSLQNSVFHIEKCTFEKLEVDAVSAKRISTFRILGSVFKEILKEGTFRISTTTTLVESNTFICSKRDDTCNYTQFGIVENLSGFTQHNSQHMCKLLQTNYCNSYKTKSLIRSLQDCYPKLLKYGVSNSCMPLEPDKGHNIYININLSLVCTLVLKVML